MPIQPCLSQGGIGELNREPEPDLCHGRRSSSCPALLESLEFRPIRDGRAHDRLQAYQGGQAVSWVAMDQLVRPVVRQVGLAEKRRVAMESIQFHRSRLSFPCGAIQFRETRGVFTEKRQRATRMEPRFA